MISKEIKGCYEHYKRMYQKYREIILKEPAEWDRYEKRRDEEIYQVTALDLDDFRGAVFCMIDGMQDNYNQDIEPIMTEFFRLLEEFMEDKEL